MQSTYAAPPPRKRVPQLQTSPKRHCHLTPLTCMTPLACRYAIPLAASSRRDSSLACRGHSTRGTNIIAWPTHDLMLA